MTMLQPSQLEMFQDQSPSYQVASPASPSHQAGSAWAMKMTAHSGRKCFASLPRSGPLGYLARTLMVSYPWRSTACYLTWTVQATKQLRLLFRLVPSERRTLGTGFLWLLKTPNAADSKGYYKLSKATAFKRIVLENGLHQTHWMQEAILLTNLKRGAANPQFVEVMMGFPPGWTDLER